MHNISSHLHSSFTEKRAARYGIARPRLVRPSYLQRTRKRTGQALLLSVLLMVFVALLAATFITVVALNLNQTARTEDKSRARQAASAGIKYVNDQLTNSPDGLKWFDNARTGIPLPTDPSYNTYYNAVDKAQGWAGQYLKFPDPLRPTSGDTPNFMVKVERIGVNDPLRPNPDNVLGEKTGDLRITVIGLSPDDTAAFSRSVSYKGGPRRNPVGGAMRVVSNNYLAGGQVPHGYATAAVTAGNTINVGEIGGKFPPAPFYIMLGGPTRLQKLITPVRSAAVTAYNAATGDMTLSNNVTVVPGERVEIAAALGAQNALNPLGTLTDTAGATPSYSYLFDVASPKTYIPVGQTTPTTVATSGSAWVNGSVSWFGNVLSNALRFASPNYVRSSGLQELHPVSNPLTPTVTQADVRVNGTYGGNTGEDVTGATLVNSTDAGFPGAWTGSGGALTSAQKDGLWSDGLNRLLGNSGLAGNVRTTAEFTPPDITDASQGPNRYLQLTKFAPSNVAGVPDAALYGFSDAGIYINNTEDRPKLYDTTARRFIEMTQKQLVDMLMSPTVATPASYQRLGTGVAVNLATASLEEKHLRGWVAPDQFLPRGALIELNIDTTTPANSFITVTRDARSDAAPARADEPDTDKAWQANDGTRQPGVYTRRFPWPTNGVIYAEGDIRIKGGVTAPDTTNAGAGAPSSLTVVSMGDIYVEGSLNAGGINSKRKVLLMARHNVIANPTAMLPRAEEHTRIVSAAAGSITVADASRFKAGDWIVVGTNANTAPLPVAAVTGVNVATNVLTVDRDVTASGIAVAGAPVRTVSDRDEPSKTTAPFLDSVLYDANFAKRALLGTTTQAIQRRVFVPPGTVTKMRLALLHSAVRRTGLEVTYKAVAGGNNATSARLASMLVDPFTPGATTPATNNTIPIARRRVDVAYVQGSTTEQLKQYPNTSATTDTVQTVENDMNQEGGGTDWGYTVAVPGTAAALYRALPDNALASYGNRKTELDFNVLPNAVPLNTPNSASTPGTTTTYGGWRFDLGVGTGTPTLKLPVATSVDFFVNGGVAADGSGNPAGRIKSVDNQVDANAVGYLGFNPDSDPARTTDQDVLTSDSGFYPDLARTGTAGYTYDSRVMPVLAGMDNSFTLRLDKVLAPLNATAATDMPSYQLAHLKIENSDMFDNAGAFQGVTPGDALDIRAFVYAQQGSWMVIPGGYVDEDLKDHVKPYSGPLPGGVTGSGYYYDLNQDGHPYAPAVGTTPADTGNTKQTNEYALYTPAGSTTPIMVPDLNRDGVATPDEVTAVSRFLRYNYSVSLTGAILENQTAMVLDVPGAGVGATPLVTGAVQNWSDRWLSTFVPAASNPTLTPTYAPLQYHFDPALSSVDANGNPDPSQVDPADKGLLIPVPGNLLYQE